MLNYETILKSLNEPQAAGNETKLCAKKNIRVQWLLTRGNYAVP